MLQICRENGWLRPIQIPTVFNGNDGVPAGNHIRQAETSIKIALVPPKAIVICSWILRHQHNHRAGSPFASALREAFDGDRASRQRYRNAERSARNHVQPVSGSCSRLRRDPNHRILLRSRARYDVIFAGYNILKIRLAPRVHLGCFHPALAVAQANLELRWKTRRTLDLNQSFDLARRSARGHGEFTATGEIEFHGFFRPVSYTHLTLPT